MAAAAKSSPREIRKGDKLGRQGGRGKQEQPRRKIIKEDKLGRQGGSSSQEQPRREIMMAAKSSLERES